MHLNNREKGLCRPKSIKAQTMSLWTLTQTNKPTINLIAASARIYGDKHLFL